MIDLTRFFELLEEEYSNEISKGGYSKQMLITALHKAFARATARLASEKGVNLT